MSIEIKMPMLSPTMTKGIIASWLVEVGDSVVAGDLIVEVETDKVTIEVEANEDGVISELCAKMGDEIPVDEVIVRLVAPGTTIAKIDKPVTESNDEIQTTKSAFDSSDTAANSDIAEVKRPVQPIPVASSPTENDALNMSPLARRMAVQQHINAKNITGSGAKGKIVKRDIELAMGVDSSKPVQVSSTALPAKVEINYDTLPVFTRKKNSGMRSVVAQRLTESSRDIPHFYMTVDCQIDTLLAMRKQLNERKNATYKISVNDFVIKAVAAAMKIVPDANCMWDGDSVIYFDQVDVSVAVAVDDGLITPVVKKACSNGLAVISNQAKELVIGARKGKLKPADYQGGTFTISNLGMFGIDNFTSIINPPQNGILSVGAGQQKPVVINGELAIATVMTVTLAMDHRCVDGAIGARFLKAFKEIIEDPISIIL
jgi:pyruvate dehydrogenase E2 component (dihydrolipoamide acetyltransferase)